MAKTNSAALAEALEACSRLAQGEVDALLGRLDLSKPVKCKHALLVAYPAIIAKYGAMAAAAAGEFYASEREGALGGHYSPLLAPPWTKGLCAPRCATGCATCSGRWTMAGKADEEKFRKALMASTDKYVKQQGRNTIALNAENDRACAGYARIPGPDACDFCVTMGAHSDFYHTRATAGGDENHGTADDRYHPYCNCEIAMIFRRRGELVMRDPMTGEVKPYDGAEMVRRYDEAGRPTFKKNRERENARRRGERRSGSVKASARNNAAGAKLADAEFDAAMKSLADAQTVDELTVTADRIAKSWPKNANGRNKAQWDEMSRFAKVRKEELRKLGDQAQALRYEPPHLTAKLPNPDPIIKTDSQLGKKIGQHAGDWGLDPSKEADRLAMRDIIDGIIEAPDEVVEGEWRSQPNPCLFFIKGDDVVVVNAENEFVSVLKDGALRNKRVKHARNME